MQIKRQITWETRKVFVQVWGSDLVSQDVSLVEEEDDGGVLEPDRMDGGGKQSQTFKHAVLRRTQRQMFVLQLPLKTTKWFCESMSFKWTVKSLYSAEDGRSRRKWSFQERTDYKGSGANWPTWRLTNATREQQVWRGDKRLTDRMGGWRRRAERDKITCTRAKPAGGREKWLNEGKAKCREINSFWLIK